MARTTKRLSIDDHRQQAEHTREIDSHLSAMLRIMNDGLIKKLQLRLISASWRIHGVVMDLEVALYRDHPDDLARNDRVYVNRPSTPVLNAEREHE